jgi:anti-sigma regulatory factor (Ser/Thr protein kinase)
MAGDKDGPAPEPGSAAPAASLPLAQDFDAGSLLALRSAVAAHAASAGLSRHQVYDVTAAAHELAANAVVHGAGHGRLRLWLRDSDLYCAVTDDGPAAADGSAAAVVAADGTRARRADGAPWPVVHGHGLWVVGQVADDVRVDRGHQGTIITARFAIVPGRSGG